MAATTRKTKKTKGAKKKTKTTKRKTAAAGRRRTITIRCRGGCTASPERLEIHVGDTVVFKTVGTAATVRFRARSPFKQRRIVIPEDGQKTAVAIRTGTFRYILACEECPTPAGPPTIIVE
jgi:plastocyanin